LEKVDEILDYKPDLIITVMGGNDEIFNISVDESAKLTESVLGELSSKVPYIFWCNSTPALIGDIKNEHYLPYAEAIIKIKSRDNVKVFDMFNEYQKYDLPNFFTFRSEENPFEKLKEGDIDPVHPNMLGNAYIAKILLKEIFGIEFDPEKYLGTLLAGEKYPQY
jgi:lysophospholipase L1-like esterase